MGSTKSSEPLLNELRQMPEFDLNNQRSERILTNILATPIEHEVEKRTKHRWISPRIVTGGAAVLAVTVVSGTLIFNVIMGVSQSGSGTSRPLKSSQTPSTPAEKYYKKILGFQPMVPSYSPKGWRLSNTVVETGNTNGQHFTSFRLYLRNKSTSSDYVEITEKKTPVVQSSPTATSQTPLIVTFIKSGVQYDASYYGGSNTISADELKKTLESMSAPDTNKPSLAQAVLSGSGNLSAARKGADFKTTIPSFVPPGFIVATGKNEPTGSTITKTITVNTSWKSPKISGKSKTVSGFLDFTYTYTAKSVKWSISPTKERFNQNSNRQASIIVSESYHVPNSGYTPTGTLQTIQGHKVRLKKEKYPGSKGTYTVYVYQWYNAATHVSYDVEGGDPSKQRLIDKATMDKVIASMLG